MAVMGTLLSGCRLSVPDDSAAIPSPLPDSTLVAPVNGDVSAPRHTEIPATRYDSAVVPADQQPNAHWDTVPPSEPATRAEHPYNAVVGKLFSHFSNENTATYTECTATAVSSSNNSTIWTSAHCLNDGRAGKFSYGEFVPAFNDNGGAGPNLDPWSPDAIAPYAPYGVFSVAEVWVPAGWKSNYDGSGSVSNNIDGYDYGAAVVRHNSSGQSLDEAIGKSAQLAFNPPLDQVASGVTVLGYPGDAPYDGTIEYQCQQTPQILPTPGVPGREFRIGCSMTAGSSGGPWMAAVNGTSVVVGNTSFTNGDSNSSQRWLTATVLSEGAQRLYQQASTS